MINKLNLTFQFWVQTTVMSKLHATVIHGNPRAGLTLVPNNNNKSFTLRLHDHKGITVLQEPLSIAKATGLLNF